MKKVFGVLFIALGVYMIYVSYTGAPGRTDDYVTFTVAEGEGVNTISVNLKDADLIRSKLAFETYLWAQKAEGKIQAGTYRLSKGNTVYELADILLSGTAPTETRVTLIEGWSNAEYKKYLEGKGFNGEEFEDLVSEAGPWKKNYGFLEPLNNGDTLEGYLYPDTYAVGGDKDLEQLIGKMLANFKKKLDQTSYAELDNPDLVSIITLASIVEKEVSGMEDRKMVANVFQKRLNDGIGLQSDATINYLTKSGRSRSTIDDLEIDSPYNTYKYRGLPPGPIGNPSIESIEAVINQTENPYYYFLTSPDGNVYYGRTFEDHQENRRLYLN